MSDFKIFAEERRGLYRIKQWRKHFDPSWRWWKLDGKGSWVWVPYFHDPRTPAVFCSRQTAQEWIDNQAPDVWVELKEISDE